jgi:hypothetical protein
MKDELKGSNKAETQDNTHGQDQDLETIRYYHGTWKNFFDYWKKRGVETDPYKGTDLIHPTKKKQEESTLPYQDFGTYKKSDSNKVLESFDEFLNESISVKDAHKETRSIKSVKDPLYMFYVIKNYIGVGYYDRVKEPEFKKATKEVLDFLISQNLNTRRMSEEYNWIITPDELWQIQLDKQD